MTRPRPRPQAQQAALSAALSGAVDLSGLKARADAARSQAGQSALQADATEQPPASGAQPPSSGAPDAAPAGGQGGQYVVEVTEANLQQLIEQSMQVPVVLEFWLANADQSQQYGDLLVRLADEGEGTWLLGRVEAESQMRVAQAMRLQGVPAVRAIFQGQMVAEFDGLQPEANLRQFLAELVRAAGGTLPEGAGPQEDPRVEQAEAAVADGDLDGAEALYRSLLADQPAHPLAKDALTQIQLMKRLETEGESDVDQVIAQADAAPADLDLALKAADLQVASGDYQQAFDRLLHIVRGTDADAKDRARERLIELFAIVGNAEPAVATARRNLASALF
ncbi:co-chaperone YbbN [Cumulibacter manganitolerans]|uniref:co-chaperone YbbN n=1 Tax=Cumulibacter manganitolerans TaxID=1884992 RepID=UPI001E2A96E3|nr:tetratricopeptide repeat protein [Cumulibacter manganitolerans]